MSWLRLEKGVLGFRGLVAGLPKVQVVGSNPAHPAKHAQSREDILGKPEVYKHGDEGDGKEPELRDLEDPAPGALNGRIPVRVESAVQGHGDQAGWPYAVRRVNEESPREAS